MHKAFAKLKGISEVNYLLYIEDCYNIYDNGVFLEPSEYKYNFEVQEIIYDEIPFGSTYDGGW